MRLVLLVAFCTGLVAAGLPASAHECASHRNGGPLLDGVVAASAFAGDEVPLRRTKASPQPGAGAPRHELARDIDELPDRPLTLEECLSIALQRSPSLELARQGVRSAEAGLRRSASSYYPSVILIGTRGRTGGTSFLDTGTGTVPFSTATERREAEMLLSQTIWETGRSESVRSSRHALNASAAREQAALQDLGLSIADLYYGALAAEQLVGVAQANLTAARSHEELARARAQVGEVPPVDVIPAQADVAEAEFSLLQTENQADLARARLKSEMGAPPTYRIRLAQPSPAPTDEQPPSLGEAVAEAQASRPELLAARETVLSAEQRLRAARQSEWGQLSLSAQYDRGIRGPKQGADAWAAAAAVTLFPFDGGSRRAEVEAARADLGSARAQEQQALNTANLEVESALLQLDTAGKSVEAAQRAVASAEAQLAAARGKYQEGVGIFVEILDAEKALVRARTNLVQARYDCRTAAVALKKATGRRD